MSTQYGSNFEYMKETVHQIVECANKHIQNMKRDGLSNSYGHLEELEEDIAALDKICKEEDYVIPLHI